MDATEVTNAEFAAFVRATHYVTTAEKAPDWEEMKKQLPPGTPKPPDSVLVAASLVFTPPAYAVPLNNASAWWSWKKQADWQHPEGPGSSIKGKENYPVVQVSWYDAKRMQNGHASGYQQKQNGNLQDGAALKKNHFPGETTRLKVASRRPTPGKAIFQRDCVGWI